MDRSFRFAGSIQKQAGGTVSRSAGDIFPTENSAQASAVITYVDEQAVCSASHAVSLSRAACPPDRV